MTKKVLIICTSHDKLGDTGESTGCWMEEVAAPYLLFKSVGYEITIASIKGGEVPMDESSLNPPFVTKDVEVFLLDDPAMEQVTNSVPIADVKAEGYDALFLPGGHGTCWDLPGNAALDHLLTVMWGAGKVIAAVCHGPGGLLGAKGADGKSILHGKQVTGFSNAEEAAVGKDKDVPFLLEDSLKAVGGVYSSAKDLWAVHAVRDGQLVTGQNPGSSKRMAELVVEALAA